MTSLFPANEGAADRIFRLLLGVGLLAPVGLSGLTTATGIAAAAGFVMLFTAAMGSCPIYTVLGLSTKSAKASAS